MVFSRQKNLSEHDVLLDLRLRLWGYWIARIQNGEEGWPHTSLLAIVMELGNFTRSGKQYSPSTNEMADEMNGWINRMGMVFPQYKDAVKAKYVPQDGRKFRSDKELASDRKISVSTFKDRVRDAKIWLSGRLDAEVMMTPTRFVGAQNEVVVVEGLRKHRVASH
jgi:hypothetical protein